LVSQALVELVAQHLGHHVPQDDDPADLLERPAEAAPTAGHIAAGADGIRRLVQVDQKPIGRTPRS
jgi:excinuclease ABC subunit A